MKKMVNLYFKKQVNPLKRLQIYYFKSEIGGEISN